MNEQEYAFVEGFVKRAAEHGVNPEVARALLARDLEDGKASVPLNALFGGGGALGALWHGGKDMNSPKEAPSRLLNITAPSLAANLAGTLAGVATKRPMAGAILGGVGSSIAGGFGAQRYNNKLQEAIEKVKAGE